MASAPSEDELVKVSSEAALEFVKEYYTALTDSRPTIENYYCTPKKTKEAEDGSTSTPTIEWNGNAYATAADFKTMYTQSMPKYVNFEVHAVDAQVLNPQFDTEAGPKVKPAKNISIIVSVNGQLRLEERLKGPLKEFHESFLLVPNIDKMVLEKGPCMEKKDWLIQVQNFRYVVLHDPITMAGQVYGDMALD
ncbi:hypothetical protein EG327_006231 [Venturia inaequalis]|uniref:NTF2 domain-containing protein n=1 Tax=Venturia inaequalis TaxID=5025 RepID=A0A8H3V695_VENIN|nr:hypothetical protein EG327_006231 [Venturia inaequalis]